MEDPVSRQEGERLSILCICIVAMSLEKSCMPAPLTCSELSPLLETFDQSLDKPKILLRGEYRIEHDATPAVAHHQYQWVAFRVIR